MLRCARRRSVLRCARRRSMLKSARRCAPLRLRRRRATSPAVSFFSGLKMIPGHSPHPNSSHHYCPLDHHTQSYFLLLHGGFWYSVSRVDPLSLGRAIPHHSQVVRSVPSHRLHVRVPQSSWQTPLPQVSNSEHARLR